MASDVGEALAEMRALAVQTPAQLTEGFSAGEEFQRAIPRATGRAYAVGMGGSGIAADLAHTIIDPETELALSIVRGPVLPAAAGHGSVVLLVSHSGETWETLAAYDEAGRRGARRIALSAGGELARRAEADGVPFLQLPGGLPPRSTASFMIGALLGLFDPFFPESNEARVRRCTRRLADLQPKYLSARGEAARLAEKVGPAFPFVYAESAFLPLARRWKTQIEENAKRLAVFDEMPELLHNAIVGWDAIPRAQARQLAVILLEWSGSLAPTRRRFDYFARLARSRGATVVSARLEPEDHLVALMVGFSLGDHFSLFLADKARVDPHEVRAITQLKRTFLDR